MFQAHPLDSLLETLYMSYNTTTFAFKLSQHLSNPSNCVQTRFFGCRFHRVIDQQRLVILIEDNSVNPEQPELNYEDYAYLVT